MLLVEDDPITARALTLLLKDRGYDVQTAATLAAARSMLADQPTHLVLDLMLPDGDGAEILRTIREKKLPIWVAVTTGVNDADRLETIESLQPSALLSKPIDLGQLLDALK